MASPDKTWSYPKAAATKRELNVADRNTTSSDRKSTADAVLLPVSLRTLSKFCYGLLRTVTFRCVHPVLLRSKK